MKKIKKAQKPHYRASKLSFLT